MIHKNQSTHHSLADNEQFSFRESVVDEITFPASYCYATQTLASEPSVTRGFHFIASFPRSSLGTQGPEALLRVGTEDIAYQVILYRKEDLPDREGWPRRMRLGGV